MLQSVCDNAKVFVDVAMKYNSVRAFIDRMIESEGKAQGIDKIKSSFAKEPECCERFLLLF
jgi:hypothetical protein